MSLGDNVILLAVTADLTGVLIPVLKSILDYMKERKQQKATRQREVLESQAKLLERLAELLWQYWKLALEVAYYGQETSARGQQQYKDARTKYDSEPSWEIGRDIHIEVSKAHRLISSPEVYKRLDDLRGEVVDKIDERLRKIQDPPQGKWRELYCDLNIDFRKRIDDALLCVAIDLGLAVPKLH
jgi:hypothetical protein